MTRQAYWERTKRSSTTVTALLTGLAVCFSHTLEFRGKKV